MYLDSMLKKRTHHRKRLHLQLVARNAVPEKFGLPVFSERLGACYCRAMSDNMTFRGKLTFPSKRAMCEALASIDADCWEQGALLRDDLSVDEARKRITVDWNGSASASTWDITLHVLETLSERAAGGEIIATFDPGEGPEAISTEHIGPDAEEEDDEAGYPEPLSEIVARGDLEELRRALGEPRETEELTEVLGCLRHGDSAAAAELLLAAGAQPRGRHGYEPPIVTLARREATGSGCRSNAA